jgi:hypothetical protein
VNVLIVHNDYAKYSGEEQAIQSISIILMNGHKVKWFRRSSADIGDSSSIKMKAFINGIYSFESKKQVENILDRETIDLGCDALPQLQVVLPQWASLY